MTGATHRSHIGNYAVIELNNGCSERRRLIAAAMEDEPVLAQPWLSMRLLGR